MNTNVNCGLSLQVTWNSSIANEELRIALMTRIIIANSIREIRVIRSSLKLHIIKFKVQISKFKANNGVHNYELWIMNSELLQRLHEQHAHLEDHSTNDPS